MIGLNRTKISFEEFEEFSYNSKYDGYYLYGSNVYYDGRYIGQIDWVNPTELRMMSDDELEEVFSECEILI